MFTSSVYAATDPPAAAITTVGKSVKNRPIVMMSLTPQNYQRTALFTFAIHGFEDEWPQDGLALEIIAVDVYNYFKSNPEYLHDTRLLIMPLVNPDGLMDGVSNNGFGRCNAQGIDINRDFDHYFIASAVSRNMTGRVPFVSPEACTLKNVVLQEKPNIVVDCHGWLGGTYGDKELSKYFSSQFGIPQKPTKKDTPFQNQFIGWASHHSTSDCRAVLLEYPSPVPEEWSNTQKKTYGMTRFSEQNYSAKTIQAMTNMFLALDSK